MNPSPAIIPPVSENPTLARGQLRRSRCFLAAVVLCLWSASVAVAEVRISDAEDEGAAAFKIETDSATYFLQKAAGGFSSIVDKDGNDWVGFRSQPDAEYPAAAASHYRGLPNLVYGGDDNGAGHPGFDQCESVLVDQHTVRSTSNSGKWQWTWTFTDTDAALNVESVDPDRAYWFLYEGPIAGQFNPSRQYWGHDRAGPITTFPDYLADGGNIDQHRWAYFGNRDLERIFFIQQLTIDHLPDLMGYLGNTSAGLSSPDGMVVFGFGRQRNAEPLLRMPHHFRIGFVEQEIKTKSDHQKLAALMQNAEDATDRLPLTRRPNR